MRSVVLVVSLGACSFALSGPHEPPVPHEHCDTESDAPTLDLAGAVVFLGIASAAFISDAVQPSGAEGRGYASLFVGGPSAVIGLVYAAATYDGFDKLSRCKSARARVEVAPVDAPDTGSAARADVDAGTPSPSSPADRSWQSSHE